MGASQSTDRHKAFEEVDIPIVQFSQKARQLNLEDCNDAHLRRWLEAANLDVEKAMEMLKSSVTWRERKKEEFRDWKTPEELISCFPLWFIGIDKFNCLVTLERNEADDVQLEKIADSDYVNYQIHLTELSLNKMMELSDSGSITQLTSILDMNNKPLDRKVMNWTRELSKLMEQNYPGLQRRCFIINAPTSFRIQWFLAKWLTPRSRSVIRVYGHEKEAWVEALRKEIDPTHLPKLYGGSRDERLQMIGGDLTLPGIPSRQESEESTSPSSTISI